MSGPFAEDPTYVVVHSDGPQIVRLQLTTLTADIELDEAGLMLSLSDDSGSLVDLLPGPGRDREAALAALDQLGAAVKLYAEQLRR